MIYTNWEGWGFITEYSIEGLNNPHAHKNTNVQFMSKDDYIIMHKSEVCETDHIDNKHHLCGLRAPSCCIVLVRAIRMLLEPSPLSHCETALISVFRGFTICVVIQFVPYPCPQGST
jgi:hypothetical protein